MKELVDQHEQSNLADAIYRKISLDLIEGRLQPGDKVRIRAFAEQLGVSVTPVRDALLRLVSDGGLILHGYRDIRVPVMSTQQFEEIRLIRLRLEGLAASVAAGRITEPELEEMADILSRNEQARAQADAGEAVRLNRLFHYRIAEFSGMPQLAELVDKFWLRTGPIIAAVYVAGGPSMIAFHYRILEALEKRDETAAETAICDDINSAANIVRMSGLLVD